MTSSLLPLSSSLPLPSHSVTMTKTLSKFCNPNSLYSLPHPGLSSQLHQDRPTSEEEWKMGDMVVILCRIFLRLARIGEGGVNWKEGEKFIRTGVRLMAGKRRIQSLNCLSVIVR